MAFPVSSLYEGHGPVSSVTPIYEKSALFSLIYHKGRDNAHVYTSRSNALLANVEIKSRLSHIAWRTT